MSLNFSFMKRIATLLGALLATIAVVKASCAETNKLTYEDLFDNPLVVKGDGFEIRQMEIDDGFRALKATLATQNQTIPPAREAEARQRLLNRMILARVLDRRANAEDRRLAKEAGEKFIEETKRRAPSEASYARQLLAVGMSVESFEQRALEQALVEQVINREIRSNLTISGDELQAFYDSGEDIRSRQLEEQRSAANASTQQTIDRQVSAIKKANLARLNRPERVTAQLMLLYVVNRLTREPLPPAQREAKKTLATELRQRLVEGEDFAALALEFSDDPDVKETGGEYVAARNSPMAEELKGELFRLPIGQWSEVIETPFGYYLARVSKHEPAGKIPFREAETDIREFLLTQKVEARLPEYFDALKAEFGVEVVAAKDE